MTSEEAAKHIIDILCENNTVKHSNMVVFECEKEALRMAIQALTQEKVGQWIKKTNGIRYWYECSMCGYNPSKYIYVSYAKTSNYCPNCGARMEREDNEELDMENMSRYYKDCDYLNGKNYEGIRYHNCFDCYRYETCKKVLRNARKNGVIIK